MAHRQRPLRRTRTLRARIELALYLPTLETQFPDFKGDETMERWEERRRMITTLFGEGILNQVHAAGARDMLAKMISDYVMAKRKEKGKNPYVA